MTSPDDNRRAADGGTFAEAAERFLEGSLAEAGFDALPTQIAILDVDGEIVYTNRAWQRFGEDNGIQGASHTIGVNYLDVCRRTDDDYAADAAEGIREIVTGDAEEFAFEYPCHGPNEKRWFTMRAIRFEYDDEQYVLVLHLNITERKLSEIRVAEQNDEIETYNQVNTLVRDVIDSLLEGVTRREIETTVCEQLADTHLYQSALVVATSLGSGDTDVRECVGIDDADEFVSALAADPGTESPTDAIPSLRAAFRGEGVQTVRRLHGNDAAPRALKEAAKRYGYRSYALVPITYQGVVYGVLVVNALRPNAFTESETEAFEVLGETVGYALNAIENRRLLFSDTLTELDFDVGVDDSFLASAAADVGCALELTGAVPASPGVHCYVDVRGAPPSEVVDAAESSPAVERIRILDARDDGGSLEITLSRSPVSTLIEYGASVRTARVERGPLSVRAVVSAETDVRNLVEALQSNHSTASLVAKRESERTVQSAEGFQARLRERLTDRQYQVLEAASLGGYFRQPRESSGGELAETFGISAPTFHQHLQAGLNKLTDLALDDSET